MLIKWQKAKQATHTSQETSHPLIRKTKPATHSLETVQSAVSKIWFR